MEKLTEIVIALLMIVNGEIKEHRIQESMSDCLKGKRIASRNLSNSVEYQCIKSMAETETDSLGNKHITKLILINCIINIINYQFLLLFISKKITFFNVLFLPTFFCFVKTSM